MKIEINKICKDNIFCEDFKDLKNNKTIDLSLATAILYGPNGTGKTSLSDVLSQKPGTTYEIQIDGEKHVTGGDQKFHVISDQNGRNLIIGETQDFILGDNIKREYELKSKLDASFESLFKSDLPSKLKNLNITKKSTNFDSIIKDKKFLGFISDIANVKSKGENLNREDFLNHFKDLEAKEPDAHDEAKLRFFEQDFGESDSTIKKTKEALQKPITKEAAIEKIEETGDAVTILNKYNTKSECVVCDHGIETESLLAKKREQNQAAIDSLNPQTKDILEKIISKIAPSTPDPFKIKESLLLALKQGITEPALALLNEFEAYSSIYNTKILNTFIESIAKYNLYPIIEEYSKILLDKPEFEDEDIIFISQFLSESLDRKIELTRNEDKNLKLLLGGGEFLNQERRTLPLSNGEQNFLSLSFELLKAKKSEDKVIVLDDPISSFDSIYKNKIAYSILKILQNKKSIILTHNTDLIKLLEHQRQNSFNLYFLNNTPNEVNGIIPVNTQETRILIYLHELTNLLRGDIKKQIIDEQSFLIAITPFMRGYCQITGNIVEKNQLTSVMHGYKTERVDLAKIYSTLFSNNVIQGAYNISAQDIIQLNPNNIKIIKDDEYPLLSKTLNHTFNYLYLRLITEKTIADKFKVNTDKAQRLTEIIEKAFHHSDPAQTSNRVFFLSRKTLLNEFNHFEIDMNIFQPAIDITNKALEKEKTEILDRLGKL